MDFQDEAVNVVLVFKTFASVDFARLCHFLEGFDELFLADWWC